MQAAVREFMLKAEQPVRERPVGDVLEIPYEERLLRVRLVLEEAQEFQDAMMAADRTAAVDALCDLLYVAFGAFHTLGVDAETMFEIVHRHNMAKFGPGATKRADGKWMKPLGWQPPEPELTAALEACE